MDDARTPEGLLRNVVVLADAAFIDGGAASVGLRSSIALAKAGIRVTVVAAAGPPMKELLAEPGLRVLCSDQRQVGASRIDALKHGLWNGLAAKTLEAALADCDPRSTVVHVHTWTKALSSSIFAAAKRLKFKVVVTLHDFFAVCPNGSLYLHPAKEICRLRPMGLRCITTNCDSRSYGVKLYRVVRQALQERAGGMPRTIHTFISVSDFSRVIMEPYLPADARIVLVENPVTSEREAPARPEDHARFLYLGRLSAEKGPALFARAAKDAGVAAAFAGDGATRDEVVAIDPAADMLGWRDARDVRAQLRMSRALVLPSLWYETYGMSVMEAASEGVPAIVPDTSASRELVVNGETGLWFEGGNAASLAAKLLELSAPGVAERLGAAAYARYWSNPPTMQEHVRKLLGVYETMLADAA
jgi:glycosyltransferase involved in cell wall biosynthesis